MALPKLFKKKESKSINQLREAIEEEYRKQAGIYGAQVFDLNAFYERYGKFLEKDEGEILHFLRSEREAIELFVKKKQAASLQRTASEEAEGGSAIAGLYRSYEERVAKYQRLSLHPNAFKEIEFLYGCLVAFHDRHIASLNKLQGRLRQPDDHALFHQVQVNMYDLLPVASNRKPKAFANYIREVERLSSDEEAIELAGQKVLRQAFLFLESLKRCCRLLRPDAEKKYAGVRFVLDGKAYDFLGYEGRLKSEIHQILKDFRLHGFL